MTFIKNSIFFLVLFVRCLGTAVIPAPPLPVFPLLTFPVFPALPPPPPVNIPSLMKRFLTSLRILFDV